MKKVALSLQIKYCNGIQTKYIKRKNMKIFIYENIHLLKKNIFEVHLTRIFFKKSLLLYLYQT